MIPGKNDLRKRGDRLKRIICLVLSLLLCLFSTACGVQEKTYPAEDYILELPYKDDFRILQLTDIHVGNKDNRALQYDFMDRTICEADADMIVVVGDLFTFADKTTARELFKYLDSYGIPWTVTFGNHDEQCYFSIDWLTSLLNSYGSNCVFRDIQGDDVFGYANFAVDLMKDGEVFEQLIVMDSNRYDFGENRSYDYIKDSQIDWYERLINYTTEQNGGKVVDSLLFFHIPLPEFADAWDAAQSGSPDAVLECGEMNEKVSCPKYNSGFFDKILTLDSSRAIIVGHDHVNNFRVLYKGIYMCYGINSTDRIYYQDGMIGGQVITVHSDHSLSFDQIYHEYSEVRDE